MMGEGKTIAVQPKGRMIGFFQSQLGVGTEKMSGTGTMVSLSVCLPPGPWHEK